MFKITPTEEQKQFTRQFVKTHKIGNRGKYDGTIRNQLVGILSQVVIGDLYGCERPKGNEFDGGFDLIIHNTKIDVKSKQRTTDVGMNYAHDVSAYQVYYLVDGYIFTSFNTTNQTLTVCGYINKEDFIKKATHYEKGDVVKRADGKWFEFRSPMYEIKQKDLEQINSKYELERLINYEHEKNV